MSNLILDKSNEAFVETDCKITFEGKTFESGGSFIAINKKTGKLGGILYEDAEHNQVTSWDGSLKIPAKYGRIFRSNFRDNRRRFVWFTYQGKHFIGINYSVDWQSCISVREIN